MDIDFWNQIAHREPGGSGRPAKFSGWITNLFGYTEPAPNVKMQEISFDIKVVDQVVKSTKTVKLVGGFRAISK